MGILGLRKYVDASGCTRLLPVPLQASEQERQQQQHQGINQEDNGVNEAAHTTSYPHSSHRHHRVTTGEDNDVGKSNDAEGNNNSISLGSSSLSSSLPARHNLVAVADHVLIDMNCIVHSCFGKNAAILQRSKHELIQDILERLRVLLTEVIIPRKSLTICLDGPAPLAKLQTQRLRRRRVALMDTAGTQTLTSLAITAGSLFMVELENALAAQFKLNNGKGFLVKLCPVFLHGTTVMGEGEAKLSRALAFLASHGMPGEKGIRTSKEEEERGRRDTAQKNNAKEANTRRTASSTRMNSRNERSASRWAKTHSRHRLNTNEEDDATRPFYNVYDSPYNPNDSVVILGNDIDLVLTGLAATMYHNISIIGPSSLQLIDIGDILYHWLKASQATGAEAAPITPAQLPSVRIDFVFLFLLNGGDHYVGAGEVALTLWKRYRIVRTAYPNDTLVSASLDAVSVEFLADVLQCETYSGDAEANIGLQLIHSALWSLYTVVTGECVDYGYCPSPSAPYVNHLRAAMSLCRQQRRRYVKLPGMMNKNHNRSTEAVHNNKYNRNVLRHSLASTAEEEGDRHGGRLNGSSSGRSTVRPTPLTPLETFVALMPSEAAMPASIAQTLRQPIHYALGQRLLSSNDAHEIATAATTVVELSEPFLSRSEQYLRQFTPPVQLNVLPRRKRLSRYEQHRLREWQASARTGQNVPSALRALDGVPIVQALTIAPVDPQLYTSTHYPVECKALWFCSPFTRASLAESDKLYKGQLYKQQKQMMMKKKAMDAAVKDERRVVYLGAGHDSTSFASQPNKQHAMPHAEDTNSATSNDICKNSNTIDTVTPIASSVAATVRHTMERVLRNEHRRQARQNQMKKSNKKSQRGSRRRNGEGEGNEAGEDNNDKKRCVMRPSAAVSSKLHSAQELGEKRLREEDAKYTEAHRLHRRERQTFLQQLRDFVGEKDVVRALGLDEKEETLAPSVAANKPAHETKKDKKKKNKAARVEQKKKKKAAAKASKKAVRPASKAQPPRRR